MDESSIQYCRTCEIPLPEGMKSPFFPFCSKRCRMADLGRWFSGDYKISEPLIPTLDEDPSEVETDPHPE